jgi:hypothetical protein
VAAAHKYTRLAVAKAAGYVPVTPTGKRIVHYINPSIYRSEQSLTPDAITALVYVNTVHGAVLSAAMYLVPKGLTPPTARRMPDAVGISTRTSASVRAGPRWWGPSRTPRASPAVSTK